MVKPCKPRIILTSSGVGLVHDIHEGSMPKHAMILVLSVDPFRRLEFG